MPLTPEQLSVRTTGIGASEIAAVAGLSPFATPMDIWMSKKGLTERIYTIEMEMGDRLEPVLLQMYAEKTKQIVMSSRGYWPDHEGRSVGGTLRHPTRKYAIATPDGVVSDGSKIVQIKTAGARSAKYWGDESDSIPDYYRAQIEQEMAVSGIPRCDVVVLIGGQDFRIYEIASDPKLAEMLLDLGEKFWVDHVLADKPPPVGVGDMHHLSKMFPKNNGTMLSSSSEIDGVAEQLLQIRDEIKAAEKEEERLQIILKQYIELADGISGKEWHCTWKKDKNGAVDWKGLALHLLEEWRTGMASAGNALGVMESKSIIENFRREGHRKFLIRRDE